MKRRKDDTLVLLCMSLYSLLIIHLFQVVLYNLQKCVDDMHSPPIILSQPSRMMVVSRF